MSPSPRSPSSVSLLSRPPILEVQFRGRSDPRCHLGLSFPSSSSQSPNLHVLPLVQAFLTPSPLTGYGPLRYSFRAKTPLPFEQQLKIRSLFLSNYFLNSVEYFLQFHTPTHYYFISITKIWFESLLLSFALHSLPLQKIFSSS